MNQGLWWQDRAIHRPWCRGRTQSSESFFFFNIVAKGWEHELACIRGQRSEALRNLWEWTCLWGLHSAARFVFEKLRRKTISSSVCCWSSCRSRAAGTAGGSLENYLWWSFSFSLTSPPSLPPSYSPCFQVYREVARTLAQMHSIQLPEGRRRPGVILIITIIIIILIFIFASSSYSSQQTLHFYKYIFLKLFSDCSWVDDDFKVFGAFLGSSHLFTRTGRCTASWPRSSLKKRLRWWWWWWHRCLISHFLQISLMESSLGESSCPIVFSHNDALPANMVIIMIMISWYISLWWRWYVPAIFASQHDDDDDVDYVIIIVEIVVTVW